MDLSEGYEEYLSQRRSSGSGLVSQTLRKQRKLEREVGPITFHWHDTDPKALELLWEWKTAQRRRSRALDILEFDWVQSFLNRIAQTQQHGLSGVVSTLRVNNKIVSCTYHVQGELNDVEEDGSMVDYFESMLEQMFDLGDGTCSRH